MFSSTCISCESAGLGTGTALLAGPAARGCNLCPQALGGAACLSGQAPNSGGTRRVSLFFLRPQTTASLRQKERHEALSAETRDFVNDLSWEQGGRYMVSSTPEGQLAHLSVGLSLTQPIKQQQYQWLQAIQLGGHHDSFIPQDLCTGSTLPLKHLLCLCGHFPPEIP